MAYHQPTDIDWDRLDRFVCDVGDADERTMLELWIAANPERRELAEAMSSISRRRATPPDAKGALRLVQERLGLPLSSTEAVQSRFATKRGAFRIDDSA